MKKYFFGFLLLFVCFYVHAQIITTIAGNGTVGYSGDRGPATAATYRSAQELGVDAIGNLYLSDAGTSVVRKVNTAGIITTFAGNGTAGFSGDNSPATAAKISSPECIAFDGKGNVYFMDYGNGRVRKVDTAGIITTFAGNGTLYTGDGVPATSTGIAGGEGLCIDAAGNIYISTGNRILKVNTVGLLTTFAGNGIAGTSGDGGLATAASIWSGVGTISMDALGNMYIVDSAGARIRKINTSGIITTVAGNGTWGFSGDGAPATAAQLNKSCCAFPDNCGNLYIGDTYNNRIRKVDGHGIITTIAGTGYGAPTSGGYGGDGGPATAAEFYFPGLGNLDKNSNIYISDAYNYRIRMIKMDSCKSVTGVTSPGLSTGGEVTVYPNPAHGEFNIIAGSKIDNLIISNYIGQIVLHRTYETETAAVNIASLPPRVYTLKVTGNDGHKTITKFLKE